MRKVTGLPKAIKVGPHSFSVVERNKKWVEEHAAEGMCDFSSYTIEVNVQHRPSCVLDTLVHEIFHAIYFTYNMTVGDDEERLVRTGSTGWLAVLSDNPALVKFINKVITRMREGE